MVWLKADFHTHTNDCVFDGVTHSAIELIDHAARLGFQVLAITNHINVIFSERWREYAALRGLFLLPGVEANIQRKHVLIINADREADKLRTFEDLEVYRRSHNVLVMAPHPYYPGYICLRRKLERHRELFDAVEYNSFYTNRFNPNIPAARFARKTGMTLVGGSDTHRLHQLGKTYSMIQAEPDLESIFEAIRGGRVRVVSRPFQAHEAVQLAATLRMSSLRMDLKRLFATRRTRRERTWHAPTFVR
ncbi:MAG: PHP domain-containing protein [Candidatus Zixiibacteriota bacterium]|nr:MAG: PHP domain-containing protein [candidate division Zixibacteria bacterium]